MFKRTKSVGIVVHILQHLKLRPKNWYQSSLLTNDTKVHLGLWYKFGIILVNAILKVGSFTLTQNFVQNYFIIGTQIWWKSSLFLNIWGLVIQTTLWWFSSYQNFITSMRSIDRHIMVIFGLSILTYGQNGSLRLL